MSEKKTAWKLHMFVSGILVMIMVVVGWVVYDDWGVERITQSDHVMPVHDVGNLLQDDLVVEQTFSASYEELTSVTFWPHLTEGSQGWLTVEILQQGRTIASGDISTTELQDYVPYVWTCNALLIPDELVVLRFSAAQKAEGYLSIFYGDTADVAGRFQVAANGLDGLTVSGTPLQGRVTFDISGAVRHEQVMYVYGIGMVVLLLGANLLLWWGFIRQKTSRISKELRRFAYTLKKYSFLLQQLVARNFNTKYRQSVLGVLWSVLNPHICRYGTNLVFPNSTVLDSFFSFAQERSPSSAVHILPQGIYKQLPSRRFDNIDDRPLLRRRLHLPEDAVVLLGSGAINFGKGIDLLVSTLAHLKKHELPQLPPFHVVWLGTSDNHDPFTVWLQLEIEDANLDNRWHWAGYVFDDKTYCDYLRAADIFVLPSREDANPSAAMEAAAMGLPIAAFLGSGGGAELAQRQHGTVANAGCVEDYVCLIQTLATCSALLKKRLDTCAEEIACTGTFSNYVDAILRLMALK